MTYQIYYKPENSAENSRGYVMFDIEYYREQSQTKDKWFSDISCLPCVEGLTHFLKDKFNEDINFDIEEFIKEGTVIQELRGLLYERFNNKPKENKEANHFHYHVFRETLEKLLNNFADKYGLYINKD